MRLRSGGVADGTLIFVAGALLTLGIGASLVAGRLRVPGLVLFLVVGMVLGSDVLGLIQFGGNLEDIELARTIGIVALALILFEGGLAAGFGEIRPVLGTSISLATAGTLITAAVVGLACHLLLDFSLLEGLLLGAIVSATDGAAIFSVLRGSSLERRLARVLEGESGLNDAVAVVLVLGFIEYITQPDYGPLNMALLALEELGIGSVVGLAVGAAAVPRLPRRGSRRRFRGARQGQGRRHPAVPRRDAGRGEPDGRRSAGEVHRGADRRRLHRRQRPSQPGCGRLGRGVRGGRPGDRPTPRRRSAHHQ